jgi:hypothetical protein
VRRPRPIGADPFAAEAPSDPEVPAEIESATTEATEATAATEDSEAGSSREGLFRSTAPEPAPSNLPEPLLEAGAPDEDAELPPLTRRPASVDRPPTDGLFSAGQGNGRAERSDTNGAAASSAPRLFGASERPPLPMPGGAHVRERPTTPEDVPASPVERTASGLTRRTPRASGEPARPRPGGEGGSRGVTTTGRSPDEVRAMLSRFRSGQRQAADDRDRPSDVDLDAVHTDEDL